MADTKETWKLWKDTRFTLAYTIRLSADTLSLGVKVINRGDQGAGLATKTPHKTLFVDINRMCLMPNSMRTSDIEEDIVLLDCTSSNDRHISDSSLCLIQKDRRLRKLKSGHTC